MDEPKTLDDALGISHLTYPEDAMRQARARIEELEAERDALIAARDMIGGWWEKEKARAERAEALLKEAVEAMTAVRGNLFAPPTIGADDESIAIIDATLARIAQEGKE